MKGFYDSSAGILDFFTSLTDFLGSIPSLATAAAAGLSLIKNIGISSEKYAQPRRESLAAKTRICWEPSYKASMPQRSRTQTRRHSESTQGWGTRKIACLTYGESLSAMCA